MNEAMGQLWGLGSVSAFESANPGQAQSRKFLSPFFFQCGSIDRCDREK
jgi:hypothetical protein